MRSSKNPAKKSAIIYASCAQSPNVPGRKGSPGASGLRNAASVGIKGRPHPARAYFRIFGDIPPTPSDSDRTAVYPAPASRAFWGNPTRKREIRKTGRVRRDRSNGAPFRGGRRAASAELRYWKVCTALGGETTRIPDTNTPDVSRDGQNISLCVMNWIKRAFVWYRAAAL